VIVWLCGCVVIAGGVVTEDPVTVIAALLESAVPYGFDTRTQ
jgi:hypothetical protein